MKSKSRRRRASPSSASSRRSKASRKKKTGKRSQRDKRAAREKSKDRRRRRSTVSPRRKGSPLREKERSNRGPTPYTGPQRRSGSQQSEQLLAGRYGEKEPALVTSRDGEAATSKPAGRTLNSPGPAAAPAVLTTALGQVEEAGTPVRGAGTGSDAGVTSLTVPDIKPPNAPWISTAQLLDPHSTLDREIAPGKFIRAWISNQPGLSKMQQASVALFMILERRRVDSEGVDLEVVVVGARAKSLQDGLENGPFPPLGASGEYDEARSLLHLCGSGDCVSTNPVSADGRKRLHTVAVQVLFKDELGEKWYVEGLRQLEALCDRSDLPAFVTSPLSAKESGLRRRPQGGG